MRPPSREEIRIRGLAKQSCARIRDFNGVRDLFAELGIESKIIDGRTWVLCDDKVLGLLEKCKETEDSYEFFMKMYRQVCGEPILVDSEGKDISTYERKDRSPFTRRFRMRKVEIGPVELDPDKTTLAEWDRILKDIGVGDKYYYGDGENIESDGFDIYCHDIDDEDMSSILEGFDKHGLWPSWISIENMLYDTPDKDECRAMLSKLGNDYQALWVWMKSVAMGETKLEDKEAEE